jgi:hypothetical protein
VSVLYNDEIHGYPMKHFAKTGSGYTWGSHSTKDYRFLTAALMDMIINHETEGGHRPNYMLRELEDIDSLVTGGGFIDPYLLRSILV